jgi:hypothetical protein
MPLEIPESHLRPLRDALVDAFSTWSDLRQFVRFQLNESLDAMTGEAGGLGAATFNLLQWARDRGRLAELIVAARNERPRNPTFQAIAETVGLTSFRGDLESIVGVNSLFLDPTTWREGLTRAEWRTCRVDRLGCGVGTGFLVGPDLVMTNYHVVASLVDKPSEAASWSCRFDHKVAGPDGASLTGAAFELATEWLIDFSRHSALDSFSDPKPGDPSVNELDFALIRLRRPAGESNISGSGERRGWVRVPREAAGLRDHHFLAMLQHPRGGPLKLALAVGDTIALNAAGTRLRHSAPTEPGSSGAPMFDAQWQLIAIHHAADPAIGGPQYNEGIPIAPIVSRPLVAASLTQHDCQ